MPDDFTDPELAEFMSDAAEPPVDPVFRERLRAELWELLTRMLAPKPED